MDIDACLRDIFGLDSFRPHQREIIEHICNDSGDGTLVVMPTGGGKSLLYQLSALVGEGMSIVVSPLISLMHDQVAALQARGVAAACVNSSLSIDELRATRDAVIQGSIKILYVAPERFKNENFMSVVAHQPINVLAVDEAHCISHWGAGFRPSYRFIAQACTRLQPKRIVALTATANKQTRADILANLHIPNAKVVVTGFHRRDLTFGTCSVSGDAYGRTRDTVLDSYDPEAGSSCGIVYMVTKKNCERLFEDLQRWDIPVAYYHAGLSDQAKQDVQNQWMHNGGIIIATTAFGMGIDKPDVRFVINGGLPSNIEEWYQMIGRGSRDGRGCTCHLFSDAEDLRIKEFMIGTQYPEVNHLHAFKRWVDHQTSAGHSTTMDITQSDMAKAAGIPASAGSGCCSFLSRLSVIEKVKNGVWTLHHLPDLEIDYSTHTQRIKDKKADLKLVRDIAAANSDQILSKICAYLEDT